jgi:transposase
MIQVTPQMRILVAVAPVDFRSGIDGLAQTCRAYLGQDPQSGALFVFRNRRSTALKVLMYDGQGYWLCHKRLSSGRFRHWPTVVDDNVATHALKTHELQLLLWGGDPSLANTAPEWRKIATSGLMHGRQ